MLNDREYEVLKKYRFGGILDSQDSSLVDKLESIGLIKTGFYDESKDLEEEIKLRTTAGLTDFGRSHYWKESIRRNPIRRWFHAFLHSV